MLDITIFLPLFTGLVVLLLPASRPAAIRSTAVAGSAATLLLSAVLWLQYDPFGPEMQFRTTLPWIPLINASYDVALDGLSLPLVVLTALLTLAVTVYMLADYDRPKSHSFLLLVMATGLIGLFSSQDLLLFYLFFEVAMVPMYFIIGMWGSADRRYSAMKFFLYTRAGSLAMLLAFLGLYFSTEPATFSLPAIAAARPFAAADPIGAWILLGMVIGFGVKLPVFPFHNWLPDAHSDAPTEGSVLLAGVLLKIGGYGFLRIATTTLPDVLREYAWPLIGLAVISQVYGALAAFAQTDLKRLIAYTSINHMGYVLIGAAIWALTDNPDVRALAVIGAGYQMISHGLLTPALFFMSGMLQHDAGTRDRRRFSGLMGRVPVFSAFFGALAFASLGLPGFSGFIAEFQVIGATLAELPWAAVVTIVSVLIITGLYVHLIARMLMGEPLPDMPEVREPSGSKLGILTVLTGIALLLGLFPALLVYVLAAGARKLAALPGPPLFGPPM